MIFNKTYLFMLFISVALFSSCSKDKTEVPLPCMEDSSFSSEIKPIFINNCTSCHNSNINYGGVILEDYNSITNNITTSLKEMKDGTMPYDQNFIEAFNSNNVDVISDSLIAKIDCWIINGMKNN
tara:strand:- start:524 stop:898 length:375 start_codon:yes stop_codon:yes gene_type:complete